MKNVKSRNLNLRITSSAGGNQWNSIVRDLPGIHVVHRASNVCRESAPCEIEPHNITSYPAVPDEYGVQCEGYGGYRVALAPFRGAFSAVRFRGAGNGDDVVSGYVVDNNGYVESIAAESVEDDRYKKYRGKFFAVSSEFFMLSEIIIINRSQTCHLLCFNLSDISSQN